MSYSIPFFFDDSMEIEVDTGRKLAIGSCGFAKRDVTFGIADVRSYTLSEPPTSSCSIPELELKEYWERPSFSFLIDSALGRFQEVRACNARLELLDEDRWCMEII